MNNAKNFICLLKNGKIKKNILPNNAPDYEKVQEKKDLELYRFYLNSSAFDELRECEVSAYNGDEQV